MTPLKIICILLILLGGGQGGDIILFADDHYKSSGEVLLNASAVNPALAPGDRILKVSLANQGGIKELIPVSGSGSADDILMEIKEEMNSSRAMEIRAALEPAGPINVTSAPQYIAALPAGEAEQLQFNLSIDQRASGWYDLPLRVEYVRQVDVSVSDGQAFPLLQPADQSLNLRLYISEDGGDLRIAGVQSDLHPGGSGALLIVVENTGEESLSNCSARLLVAPPLHAIGPDCSLGDLAPGKMALASFRVGVDGNASLDRYQLGLSLSSEEMDLVLPLQISLRGSGRLSLHRALPFIAPLALLAILILLAGAVIIPGRQKLLYGRKRKIRRL